MFRVDLHTHSYGSPDGGITRNQYERVFEDGTLDYVAVTDHNSISAALELQKVFGKKIIVGEEIMTTEGEIVGLFLSKEVPPHKTPAATVAAIKKQGGLVYIPHPFETVRSGLDQQSLDEISDTVDIVEVYNGRAVFQNKGPDAAVWAHLNNKATAAASDAHGIKGVGSAYVSIKEKPTVKSLVKQLRTAHPTMKRPPLRSLLYPKLNRLRGKVVSRG